MRSPPFRADVQVLVAVLARLQHPRVERPDLRAGLDTLYAGGFPTAAAYFADLAGRDTADPAPVIFEARAYIWWAEALENDDYDTARIDSLLELAIRRAGLDSPGPARDFCHAPAPGYRAHQRDLPTHPGGAAKAAKATHAAY